MNYDDRNFHNFYTLALFDMRQEAYVIFDTLNMSLSENFGNKNDLSNIS